MAKLPLDDVRVVESATSEQGGAYGGPPRTPLAG